MRKIFIVALGLAAISGSQASAQNNTAEIANEVCAKCHGPDGDSRSPLFPRLAGQQAEYIEHELHDFRDRLRDDPHAQAYMWGIAGPLTDAQITGLAKYFSQKEPAKGVPSSDPAAAAKGKQIFQNGAEARGIPACATCHGGSAEGGGQVPRLAGQHLDYLFAQIRDFRSELRENETMHENTKNLTDEDALALAQYLSSL